MVLYRHRSLLYLKHAGDDEGFIGTACHHTDIEAHGGCAAVVAAGLPRYCGKLLIGVISV